MIPLREKKKLGGWWFILIFIKILKMHDFNQIFPWCVRTTRETMRTGRVRPWTTCWHHITREFGLISLKNWGGGENHEKKMGEQL